MNITQSNADNEALNVTMSITEQIRLVDMAAPALELSHLGKRFGATQALQDISLTVKAGEIICLVGHSGCGKTTLLKIISGVDAPDSGTIFMGGSAIAGPTLFVEPERRRIGVVFQDYALFPHLTVEQNILFGLRKTSKSQALSRTKEMLELVDLAHMADKYPHMLSGGEQQRVALARALAPKPDILLMDEPFSNLDRGLREKVRGETIALLRKLGTTVIFVTHDAEEALSTGDRVVLMKAGRIVQAGTPRDLYDQPCSRDTADFFCDFNIVHGTLKAGRVETPIGSFDTDHHHEHECPAVVYLRPCDICPYHAHEIPSAESLMGSIETRTFRGDVEELTVRVDPLSEPLRLRTTTRLPSCAQQTHLSISREKALIFKAD